MVEQGVPDRPLGRRFQKILGDGHEVEGME
jgi:hypothetical protein